MLSPYAQDDIKEFYSVYNPDKIEMVPMIIAQATTKSLSAPDIFNSLYSKYNIERLATRTNVMLQLKQTFPHADDELILSVLRNIEFKQAPAESAHHMMAARLDEIHLQQLREKEEKMKEVQRKHNEEQEEIRRKQAEHQRVQREMEEAARRQRIAEEEASPPTPTEGSDSEPTLGYLSQAPAPEAKPTPSAPAASSHPRPPTTTASTPSQNSKIAAADEEDDLLQPPYGARVQRKVPSKQTAETVMGEELRDWLVSMVGDYFDLSAKAGGLLNGGHRLLSEANVCDALRDGAVLAVLQQRLRNPTIAASDIKKPRTQGFFGRENTSIFIEYCRKILHMRDEVLFTDSDLCDAKNDRMAVNSLLTVAAIVYKRAKDLEAVQQRADKESMERYGTPAMGSTTSTHPAVTAPKLIVYQDEISKHAKETTAESVDNAVQMAMMEEQEEEERRSVVTNSRQPSVNNNSNATPPRGGSIGRAEEDAASPSQDLIEALQRQRLALEKQREAEMEAERKRVELEALERERYEEARRAAQEQREHAIRVEKERKLFEVIEMKRQWIQNQLTFLQSQAIADRNGLAVAEEHTRFKLQEQIRTQARFLLDRDRLNNRALKTSVFPDNVPTYSAATGQRIGAGHNNAGIYAPSPARHYVPIKGDDIDKKVSRAVNRVFGKHTYSNTRIKRLSHTGEYVVFHKITGKRTVVYVRDVRENLMIRVGGGWDDFEGWLERHVHIGLEGGPASRGTNHNIRR